MQVNCAPVRKKIIYNIPADADDSVNPLPPAIPTVRQGFSLLGCIRLTLMILSTHSPLPSRQFSRVSLSSAACPVGLPTFLVSRPDSSRGRESLFLVFRQLQMGVAEMGVVTMLKLAGYYLYSRTDLVRFERFYVLEITFLVDVYRNLS